ncbi:MAG: 3-hydroxyacyl-CoA dehydrogenase [Peptococcaceae bacterium BICA1-7]|nr:MAG: 3-hydroxyacyl-CoA dehydrogenase [Peptococcaceae bacterium BICA1-7]HBV95918.1 3-hydroxyacyl-CoA dehydrogenase family protein [Desulfotomaculum sp.]
MDIKKICVVGAGNMGHQIALNAAISGFTVKCTDVNPDILKKAEDFVNTYLPQRVAKGKMTEEKAKAVRANISFTANLKEAARDVDLVIEAVLEILDLKRKIFKQLDEICPPHTILATNSSFIVSSKIADVTNRPDKVCNMHYFNPALVMKLVEVVQGAHTSDETAASIMEVSLALGKEPVLLKKEIEGFLVNRIMAAICTEALHIYDMGVSSFEEIDKALMYGLGHPMGAFRLMDLTGIDLTYILNMEKYKATGDPQYKPSPYVVEKYVKGEWGQKTGKGWYDYTKK